MKSRVLLRVINERNHAWKEGVRSIVNGGAVVCIASGPSLTPEDVAVVKDWRDKGGGRVFVANTTFRTAPWADLLFAIDANWWGVHAAEVERDFKGACYAMKDAQTNAVKLNMRQFYPWGNTGAAIVALAMHGGAKRVVMLGYDCQHTGGQTHWHGNHPAPLGNAGSVDKWAGQFRTMARVVGQRTQVFNASRQTALTCFQRAPLEECL